MFDPAPAILPVEVEYLPCKTAEMPTSNWNDLRFLLAISRGRTLATAAQRLSVDNTTVARHLAALQAAMGTQLVQRAADGTFQLTPAGETAVLHAEIVEREIGLLSSEVAGTDTAVAGTVRLTAVPIVVNRLLVPAVGPLLQAYPALDVELNAEARNLSLTRREADMALRLARPQVGGARVKARRIGTLKYAGYAASTCPPSTASNLPWISYQESLSHLPQARWMARATRDGPIQLARLKVSDAEAAIEAVAAGLGRSLLPRMIGDGDPRLRRLEDAIPDAVPEREVWLLVHTDLASLARIVAVTRWLEEVFP